MKLTTKTLLVCTAAAAFVGSAHAATINVKMTGSSSAQSTITNPGYGLWGQGTETWNRMNSYTGTNLADSDGNATTIDYAFTATGSGTLGPGKLNNNYGDDAIQTGGIYGARDSGGISILTLSGLTVGTPYEIIVFMAEGGNGWGAMAFQGVNPSDYTGPLTATGTDVYLDAFDGASNSDFWYWTGVAPTASGEAVLSINDSGWDVITAIQIREVPEPGSLALLGLGGLLIARRRRG